MPFLRDTLVALTLVASTFAMASADTLKFEGVAAIAAGALNPPNPVEGCNRAKQDAEQKHDDQDDVEGGSAQEAGHVEFPQKISG